jgi:L-alanine-DL-glutamate epimerase-like enolase superfamily enzyme
VVSTLTTVSTRVALLVQVEDEDGHFGWGEIYATLPSFSADHKVNVLHQFIFPLIKNRSFNSPIDLWSFLEKSTYAMQIQTGEFGPFSSVIAGLDCAIWDLLARRGYSSLTEFLGGKLRPLPIYASGLNPADGPLVVEQSRALGFKAFKQKIGFGMEVDQKNLQMICDSLISDEQLMVDVNQGWSIDTLRNQADMVNAYPLHWVEEPLLADASEADWQEAKDLLKAPLAGGENLRNNDFVRQSKWLHVLQPDVGKWGGISGNWLVAKNALLQQKRYCPHWLGSGIGLITSAHLLCAIGGDGLLRS